MVHKLELRNILFNGRLQTVFCSRKPEFGAIHFSKWLACPYTPFTTHFLVDGTSAVKKHCSQQCWLAKNRQCRYNATWSGFVEPQLQWISIKYYIVWERVFSLWHPACNARKPYCQLWPVRLYSRFSYYLINGKIFGKKKKNLIRNIKCVF